MPSRILSTLLVLVVTLGVALPGAAQDESPPSPGTLAIVGSDANLYLYDVATENSQAITTDGDPRNRTYTFPTWAPDGRLAFFGASALSGDSYRLGVFLRDPAGRIERVYRADDEVFTYAYWSPGTCADSKNCRDLALLYTNSRNRLALRMLRDADTFSMRELSEGGPHYWDWSPDGSTMFWARFSDELALYDVESGQVDQSFTERQGFQRAVDWSPSDDRLLTAVRNGRGGSALTIFDGDERLTLADDFRGALSFMWSPGGERVAFLDETTGDLSLINDDGSGRIDINERVIAFWWSPDGRKIAFLQVVLSSGQGPVAKGNAQAFDHPVLVWNIYNLQAQSAVLGAAFLPTNSFIYYLNFYDQFARSHRIWSPDSRYVAYAETERDGSEVIQLMDTATTGLPVQRVMAGNLAVFSWQ